MNESRACFRKGVACSGFCWEEAVFWSSMARTEMAAKTVSGASGRLFVVCVLQDGQVQVKK